ncbi:MAG: excinuclease ABC subunit UvrB [Patescibacteria group bacterium]
MAEFKLKSQFKPTGDQPQAIEKLTKGIRDGRKDQVLLGVTGSGKTFSVANVIKNLGIPTLVISHNKTLAGQLYQEMREFFPQNAVSYFVSYYDYYQPEAYIPQTDTYIEKEADINALIEKLRLQTTANIMTRKDVIVVASVSCIYNIGSPLEWGRFILDLKVGDKANWKEIATRLVELQYERNEFEFSRGTFRVRGESVDIYPAYEDAAYRLEIKDGKIKKIEAFEPVSGKAVKTPSPLKNLLLYPAKQYLTSHQAFNSAEPQIRADLQKEVKALQKAGRNTEAERLNRRVNYDLEMIKEMGYVSGIENYSRYFDGRSPGDPPHALLDYFKETYGNDFLVVIDESHITVPQIRGMYNGDKSRKGNLVDFGFRLKAAMDNRPLKFEEFYSQVPHIIYTSATPDEWELGQAQGAVAEQLVRPTGIVDPVIEVRPAKEEVEDLIKEVEKHAQRKERVLVTTLTKRTAEDLTDYLAEKNIKASYLHSDVATLERSDVLDNLRKGDFDVLVGVNLLREGLDLPEVTLVAILDADKEGFLRSKTSLIQTMGRAARNTQGHVILYADSPTGSMKAAMAEIERRRRYQLDYNQKHGITPKTIQKAIRGKIIEEEPTDILNIEKSKAFQTEKFLEELKPQALTPYDRTKVVKRLEKQMKTAAEDLNFELAIKIRNKVRELKD